MEPDVKAFLIKIMQSLSVCLLWLLINMSIGIYYGLAFFEHRPSTGNLVYYACLLGSFIFLIRYLRKKWKGWDEVNY